MPYIKTDINELHTSTSIKNNLIKKSSKEIEKNNKSSAKKLKKQLINKNCFYKKIKSLKSQNLCKNADKLYRFHEYNIITFFRNHIRNNLNFQGNCINKMNSNQIKNTEEIKNKNKIIINDSTLFHYDKSMHFQKEP